MIYDKLPRPFFILAPMYDVTDTVFRQIIADLPYASHLDGVQGENEKRTSRTDSTSSESRKQSTQQSAKSPSRVTGFASKQAGELRRYGPDVFFTEFVNVDGLQSPGRPKIITRLKFSEKERPIIAQIWGKNPENYYKIAKEIVEMGYDGVDINMGCPDKAVIKNGCCSALIDNRDLAKEIIAQTKKATRGRIPISVKTRLGLNSVDLSWPEFLLRQNLDMLTIHGRTAKQMSKVPADWSLIEEVRKLRDKISQSTLVVGNGDVMTRSQGIELAKKHGLDGIMIGRGVFEDPFVFAEDSPWASFSKQEKIDLYAKHVRLFVDVWGDSAKPVYTLNKFCKIYIQGFDGAKELRERLMSAKSTQELLKYLY